MTRLLLPLAVLLTLSGCAHLTQPVTDSATAAKVETALQDMVWSVEEADSVGWLSDATSVKIVSALTQAESVVSETPQGAVQTALEAVQTLQTDLAADSKAQPYLSVLASILKGLG
jgi:uncharacterized protein YceK